MKHYSKKNITDSSIMESNGPCGKIRGTIQQIIDKYESALNENNNAQDEVKLQNILQYIDHYTRLNQLKKEKFSRRRNFHLHSNHTPTGEEADLAIASEIFDAESDKSTDLAEENVVTSTLKPTKLMDKSRKKSEENMLISEVPYLNKDISDTITKLEQDE